VTATATFFVLIDPGEIASTTLLGHLLGIHIIEVGWAPSGASPEAPCFGWHRAKEPGLTVSG
jgi:hypothetical protein